MPTYPTPVRHHLSLDLDGKQHQATYWVAGKILTVTNGKGSKSKQTGEMEHGLLARQLLSDLVRPVEA